MKNIIIILIIFIVPLVAYRILSNQEANQAGEAGNANRPQIIKFSALMCAECKKLDGALKEIYPKYKDKIDLVKVQVQNEDANTKNLVKKYNITLTPTMILLDSKGNKIDKIEGFVEKPKLEKMMKDLSSK